jgi:hypothetical protein
VENIQIRPLQQKAMKNKETLTATCATIALIGIASRALAASGGKGEGSGVLIILFLTFGALIIVFQFIPGVVLFVSMIKGLFGKEKETIVAKESVKNH